LSERTGADLQNRAKLVRLQYLFPNMLWYTVKEAGQPVKLSSLTQGDRYPHKAPKFRISSRG
jgi:hypothetical protein